MTTLGERGQIVIPKKARGLFNLEAGDEDRGTAIVPEHMMNSFFHIIKTPFEEGEE